MMMSGNAPTPSARPRRRAAQINDFMPLGDWLRHRSLRSWPVILFLVLVCVPSMALVVLGEQPTARTFDHVAWIYAAYFALAWLLLLGVIVRPDHVTRAMLIAVTAVALATQVPLALALETALHSSTSNLGSSIVAIGLPEELAKALPVLTVALIYRHKGDLNPRDYLFLGAVSGLAFGAAEVVRYFTVYGAVDIYQTVHSAGPSIERLMSAGKSTSASVFIAVIGPVLSFVLDFVWRFLTDPITHACWSGLTGYFIGLAATGRYKWYKVAWIGLAIAAILHGLNDWSQLNGRPLWILVVLGSGILFLGYAKVGSRSELHFADGQAPEFLRPHTAPTPGSAGRHLRQQPGGHTAGAGSERRPPDVPGGSKPCTPWWEH
jgi:RsiW-degrading membrane proteinase PrsW (M82 family)